MTPQPEALRLADALDHGVGTIDRDRHKAAAELRRLHAENEALQNTKHYEAPQGFVLNPDYLVPELRAEVEALRADAERYRWLREESGKRPDFYSGETSWMVSRAQGGMGQNFFGEKIDAAIDAARSKT